MPELYTNDSSNTEGKNKKENQIPKKEEIKENINIKQEVAEVADLPQDKILGGQEDNGKVRLTQEELNDPNAIEITITDEKTPIVVFFGPQTCGKTMTLVRLSRFLKKEGYKVNPIRTFRPSTDTNYRDNCDNFDNLINSNDAAVGTGRMNFMLIEVRMMNGRILCQILEAPGEYYFNPKNPKADFPAYVNSINTSNNRKIWVFMLEPNWLDSNNRRDYVDKIGELKKDFRPRDKAIFLYNKIDKTKFIISPGQVRESSALKDITDNYPGIFMPFKNQNPITKFFKEYRFDFIPFQTGKYAKTINGVLKYQESAEEYPRRLWNTILKRIRG
jgi:hypothetical protein